MNPFNSYWQLLSLYIYFSIHFRCAEVRENTIASLKSAASHGADFVEFDVQLSRDLIPVLYHDFYVAIAMRRKTQVTAEEMLQLPVKDLSLEQLQRLKVRKKWIKIFKLQLRSISHSRALTHQYLIYTLPLFPNIRLSFTCYFYYYDNSLL